MRALVVEREAREEIASALDWYDAQEPGLGAALLAEIDAAVGVPGVRHTLAIRRVIFERFPYTLVFLERADTVHVLALAHQRRRPGYWRGRMPK
jgi:hypothetical protein